MWERKRLWLLFFALLYLKDVSALGVWDKSAKGWYGVAAQVPLAQPQPASFHGGAQMSTAIKEGFQGQTYVSYAQATSNQDVPSTALQNSYGTPSSVSLQPANTVSPSLPQQRPQVVTTLQTTEFWMQNASSYTGSQSQTSSGSGLSQKLASLYAGQSSSSPVTLPASVSTVSNGSTTSSDGASQSQGLTVQGLASQFGGYGLQTQQGTTQLSSAPGLSVLQPSSDSAASNGSAPSASSSYSVPQSPSTSWQSLSSLSSQYVGLQGLQSMNQINSAPGLTVIQPASLSVVSSSTSSSSGSYSVPQSPSTSWLSLGLSNQYVGSQGQQGTTQLSSPPGLTVIQPASPNVVSNGSAASASGSYSVPQSPSSSWLSLGLSRPSGSVQTQGTTQLSSSPGLTVIQPASPNVVSNGSAASASGSYSVPQSPSSSWLSLGLSNQYVGSQGQQGTTQLSSPPGLTVIQPASPNVVSNGSAASASGSYSVPQSPSTSWLSLGLSNQYVGSQAQQSVNQLGSQSPSTSWLALGLSRPSGSVQTQGTTQLSSSPGLTVIQPASPNVVSNGSAASASGSYPGSQSPSTSWLPLGLSNQYVGSQAQQGTTQLSSSPGLPVSQPASPSVVSSSTSSSSSSYPGSQSQSTSWLSLGLSNQYVGSQGQQGTTQLSSPPGLTVIQPASPNVVSNGSAASASGSYSVPQSPSSSWLSLGLSNQYVGSQAQQGTTQLSSPPGLPVIQPASPSVVSNGSATSASGSYSVPQSPSSSWLSLGLSRPSGSVQTQGTTQLSSSPGLTVIQPASPNVVSNGSAASASGSYPGSQSPSTSWLSLGLSNQYVGSQGQQGTTQLSSPPGLTVIQPASPSVVSSGTSSSSSSYPGSQSPSTSWLSLGLSRPSGSVQAQQGTTQLSSPPGLPVIQPASPNVVSNGSATSASGSYSVPQSPSTSWLSLGLSSPSGSVQTQGTTQMSSSPGLTVIQPASPNVVSNGSAASASGSYSVPQSPSSSWLSLGLSNQYVGSQGQQGTTQLSSPPGLTVIQPASPNVVSNGSAASASGSYSVPQSPSTSWLSLGLSNQYVGSQAQQSVNQLGSQSPSTSWLALGLSRPSGSVQTQGTTQLSSSPGLTVIQPASPNVVSNGSAASASGSYPGSQSPSTSWLPLGLSNQYVGSQAQQGTTQLSSSPGLPVSQPASPSVVSSSTSSSSSSYPGSQSQSTSWLSLGLSNQYVGSQGQQGTTQLSSPPGLTVIQPASPNVVSNGSAASASGSYSVPQSPSSSWLSLGLSNQYVGSQAQQGTTQLSSPPGLPVIQPASPSVVSNGSATSASGSYSVPQSPSSSWLSLGLSRPSGSVQAQQGTTQLSSPPGLPVIQPASPNVVSNGSATSASGSYSVPQSPSTSWLSLGLSSPSGSVQTQGTTQMSSSPGLTVIQPASPNVVSNGSAASASGSYSVPQSPSTSWLSLGLSNQYVGSQGQQGTTQLSSPPGLTVIQPASPNVVSNGSAASASGSYSVPQSPSTSWLSLGLSNQYVGSQAQQSVNQLGSQSPSTSWLALGLSRPSGSVQTQGTTQLSSSPGLTVIQPASPNVVSNGSAASASGSYPGSQSPSTSWLPLGLSNQYVGSQAQQGTTQLSSSPGLPVSQPASPSVVSSSTSSSSSSYPGSQSQSTSWLSLGLSNQYVGSQGQQGTTQLSSPPGLTVIQPASPNVVSNGSAASASGSYSVPQSPSSSWLSLGLSNQYVGSQAQQGTTQLSSSPGLTVIQPASPNVVSNGSAASASGSYPGSQSPSTSWLSLGLSNQYVGSQGQQGTTQLSSPPGLTVIQLASPNVVSNGSAASASGSYPGSQSPSTSWLPLGLSNQYVGSQAQQGTTQLSSSPGLPVSQPASPSVVSSSTSSSSSSYPGSQSQSTSWLSLGLSNQYVGSQGQQGATQLSSPPGLTVIQPASPNVVSNGSAASASGSYSVPQSPSTSWLSLGLSSPSGSVQTQGTTQMSSSPGLPVSLPASPSVVSSGTSSSSSSYPGSQSPSTSWLSLGLSRPSGSVQAQQGTTQLSSPPGLPVIQPASPSVVSNGSATSASGSYSVPQSPSTSWLSLGLSSPSGSVQTQGTTQMSSSPGLPVSQPASPSVVSSSTSSSSSSYPGSQSPSTSWLPLGLSNQYVGSQAQQSVNQLGSQSPSTSWLSLGLSRPSGSVQAQQGTTQQSSAPGLSVIQLVSDSAVSNGSATSMSSSNSASQGQGSTGYGLSQGLASQYGYGSFQTQNQLSSAPGLTVIKQASPSVVSSGTTSSSSGLNTGSWSQSTTGYWVSQGLSSPYGLQTQQSTPQLNKQASNTLPSSNFQNPSLSQAGGGLAMQKPRTLNQQVPALWMGQYYCKNGFNSSSNSQLS